MSITGEPDAARGQPVKVGVGIADVMCGMYATVGVLAALRHRDRTGEGQYIDLALYDSQVAWLINAATNHLVSGRVPRRSGMPIPTSLPIRPSRQRTNIWQSPSATTSNSRVLPKRSADRTWRLTTAFAETETGSPISKTCRR